MTKLGYKPKWTKKQIEEGCDELVMQGKLVKINYDSKNPSWQETEKFLESVWGVTNQYEPCEKCGDMVDLAQQEFMRMAIGLNWVYLHIECTQPHIGFYAIKHYYENLKKVPHAKLKPHVMTKAEKELVKRFFKSNFKALSQKTDEAEGS